MIDINFDNTYKKLPARFFSQAKPAIVPTPQTIEINHKLIQEELGIDLGEVNEAELNRLFTGQEIPLGAQPIATVYAGHQFGHFSPQLGDGRAILLGEITSPTGQHYDIQLKGSGVTPYSRRGDGKSSLGPVIREYILSEAMAALKIPTTRALAASLTGETVYREEALPGGIFTRMAKSHIRIGTFQYFAAQEDSEAVKELIHYTINRHYPESNNDENIYLSFLHAVANAQALMVANWMSVGFIHGVMNTDNMSITGETLDYGPCAFMDHFSFDKVFSSIDRYKRYAYNNQMEIAKWNLFRLAECLIPLLHTDPQQGIKIVEKSLENIDQVYQDHWLKKMSHKFGIFDYVTTDDFIINSWLKYLQDESLDFTTSFRHLSDAPEKLKQTTALQSFQILWKNRLSGQPQTIDEATVLMKQVNPIYIARNHQVEKAISAAISGNFSPFKELNTLLQTPYTEQKNSDQYQLAPQEHEKVLQTFCGT